MSKDKLIVSQVAFKGAIDLAVAGKIGMEHIMPTTKKFADDIWEAYGTTESSFNSSSFNSSSGGSSGGQASDKQISFIKKLIKEVPKFVADPAQAKLDAGLTGLEASAVIKLLLIEKEANQPKPKDPDNDNEAPF